MKVALKIFLNLWGRIGMWNNAFGFVYIEKFFSVVQ